MSALVFDLVDQISQSDFGSSDVVRVDVVLNLGQGQSQQVCFWFVDATLCCQCSDHIDKAGTVSVTLISVFIGTDPTDEPITSGLPIIREESQE
jgi:hypothetical protein